MVHVHDALQIVKGGDDLGGEIHLRDQTVWIKHNTLGRVQLGMGSTATDDLILIDLSGAAIATYADPAVYNGSFQPRVNSITLAGKQVLPAGTTFLAGTWAGLLNQGISFDTDRRNHVRYDTPTVGGFTASVAAGEDNFWDSALRYAGEFSGFRLAAGVGYSSDQEFPDKGSFRTGVKNWLGSASVMHVNSGIFVTTAGGTRESDVNNTLLPKGVSVGLGDPHFWHVSAGISKNWTGWGATVLYGEYHQAKDMVALNVSVTGLWSLDVSSDASMWGFGVVQHVDAAAMELFLAYKNYSADVSASTNPAIVGVTPIGIGAHDFQAVIGGGRVRF